MLGVFRIVFGVFFVLNLILWINGSSAAVPFSTLVALLALWFGISVPLTFVGAYFGFKKLVRLLMSLLTRIFYSYYYIHQGCYVIPGNVCLSVSNFT